MVKSEEMPMKMAKSAPLVSQGKMLDENRRVELVSVAMDNFENGRWRKNLRKWNLIFGAEMYIVSVLKNGDN